MSAIPISKSAPEYSEVRLTGGAPAPAPRPDPVNLANVAAAGALVAGGVLLLTGRRRAAAAVAAAGTAYVLLEEKESVKLWWERLPGYLAGAEQFLNRVEDYLREVGEQGHRLQNMLRR